MKSKNKNIKITKTNKDGSMYDIMVTDSFDPYDDCIELYAHVKGENCTITDDGYTNFNLICFGKADSADEITVKGKVSDLDNLINKELKLIYHAYDILNPKAEK